MRSRGPESFWGQMMPHSSATKQLRRRRDELEQWLARGVSEATAKWAVVPAGPTAVAGCGVWGQPAGGQPGGQRQVSHEGEDVHLVLPHLVRAAHLFCAALAGAPPCALPWAVLLPD